MRLLDVGCGSLVIHAARHHGAHAVAITLALARPPYPGCGRPPPASPTACRPYGAIGRGRFIDRSICPDGDLVPLATMVGILEDPGLQVREVQALREHYATLTARITTCPTPRGIYRPCAAANPALAGRDGRERL